MSNYVVLAGAVVLLNVPFGYIRAGYRRFSLPWFLAVHIPVPLVVGLRMVLGVGWRLSSFPLVAAAFFAGHYIGGALRRRVHDAA